MSTFVLVHGGWHGGWCWQRVAEPLRRMGHRVYAPSLTGLADRAHLLTSEVDLDTHVADIVRLIEWEDLSDVILCGHSYGGGVITRVADEMPASLSRIVYLDAFRPADGETIGALAGWEPPVDEIMPVPPAAVFGLEGADAAYAERKMTPHPSRSITTPVRVRETLAKTIAPTYVLATRWGGVPHFVEKFAEAKADPRWTAVEVDGGHDLMLDHAGIVVDILVEGASHKA